MRAAMAGVVLCGGGSRRMGGDKAMLALVTGGPPLFRHVAELLAGVASPVMLAPGVVGRLGITGHPEVADAVAGSGPLGGLVAALEAAPHPLLAVVAVDMPFVSTAVLGLLADLCADHDAAVARLDGAAEPLHAVYARRALPALRRALRDGDLGLRRALGSLDVRWVEPEEWRSADPRGTFALNLNSPADVEGLPRIRGRRRRNPSGDIGRS